MAIEKEIQNFGSFIEEAFGFAQAVRTGDTVYVSGQTAFADGAIVGIGDMKAQMQQAYESIAKLLAGYGASMQNVVDETLFVTDMAAAAGCAREVRGRAYGDDFEVASSLIGVAALGAPDLMIEIKCTAHL